MCATKMSVAPDCKDFFADRIETNLTKVTWVHAVNSKEKLHEALATDKAMMLEADVVLGTLNDPSGGNDTENIPIMAHPPEVTSDLSLEEFLESVLADGKRGIKLDFKSIEAFKGSQAILEKHRANLSFPVWLNADILVGPVEANPTDPLPVEPNAFIAGAATSLPESTLSIGWTTRYGSKFNITEGEYTNEQIRQMVEVIARSETKQSITYPVRAGLAAGNVELFKDLLEDTSAHGATLTVWSSPDDTVDVAALSKFIKDIGVDKVYVDVPDDILSKLNISGATSYTTSSIVLFASLVMSFAITKLI
ncbi:protein FAM151B isoform X2 [Venturia canescens]|nr:protein FAM151B isoform X2 [Venturia canescens]